MSAHSFPASGHCSIKVPAEPRFGTRNGRAGRKAAPFGVVEPLPSHIPYSIVRTQ